MKRSRKTLFALLLALVMTLGLAATAWAAEGGETGTIEVIPGVDPGNAGAWKSFEIPFTKTVELGGNTAPGETTFSLEITNFEELKEKCPNAEYKTVVTINNGADSYNGKLIISGSENLVKGFLKSGFYVREKNDNQPGWKYSDKVWYVECTPDGSSFNFYPAEITENGESYNKVENADAVDKMTFTNTYTYNYTSQRPAEKPNTPETAITAPKTFDAGVALYGVSALLSLTGAALVIKRKNG